MAEDERIRNDRVISPSSAISTLNFIFYTWLCVRPRWQELLGNVVVIMIGNLSCS